jgi:hypothetical protein
MIAPISIAQKVPELPGTFVRAILETPSVVIICKIEIQGV